MCKEEHHQTNKEEDMLHCSTNKVKDDHPSPNNFTFIDPSHAYSYKSKLAGHVPGAYENAFQLFDGMHEDVDSNLEIEDNLSDGIATISLSNEDKICIRS